MNKKQRIIMWIGLGLILFTGLFPFYHTNHGKDLGYYFILTPPHYHQTWYEGGNELNKVKGKPIYNGNISVSRFFMQIVTILILTVGLVVLFAGPKKDKNGK